ncbi:MAG: hypothetical protein ING19_08235 [Azospirillum sp.]|jgi:hypothetical protein|nr:hypothetical protein [Azospirillum sp.]
MASRGTPAWSSNGPGSGSIRRASRDGTRDDATQAVLVAFQRRFRARKFDGPPDGETHARLRALVDMAGA